MTAPHLPTLFQHARTITHQLSVARRMLLRDRLTKVIEGARCRNQIRSAGVNLALRQESQ